MTDEEKKAIEDLKEVVELYNDKCLITTEDDFKSIEILLNLIEKQSKEIEHQIEKRANQRNDLLDIVKQKDKIIDEILKTWKQDDVRSIAELKKYFEERCK